MVKEQRPVIVPERAAESIIVSGSGYFDPYDHWSTDLGVKVRETFYSGRLVGKFGAVALTGFDWIGPFQLRRILGCRPGIHPITAGHLIKIVLAAEETPEEKFWDAALNTLEKLSTQGGGNGEWLGWGLGFRWMCKNGLYPEDTPFVTHTPYVLEALLALVNDPHGRVPSRVRGRALDMFKRSLGFLDSLKVMYRDADAMALSYGPVEESRIVVNANTYAAYSYALHAVSGNGEAGRLDRKIDAICRWVARQQQPDGSWFYFADDLPGNLLDGFHSCLVLRNLIKISVLIQSARGILQDPISKGWRFLREKAYDQNKGLLKRFVIRDFMDPYPWDIYDQAEYLGLLIDFGELREAARFRAQVSDRFSDGVDWWCRLDFLGRRWGKNFLRWGIVPFWYHSARLDHILKENPLCAE